MEVVSILLFILTTLLWLLALVAGVLLAAVLLAVLLVLFLPLHFRTRAEGTLRPDADEQWDGSARWEADLRWGGYLVRMWLRGTHTGVEERRVSVLGFTWPTRSKPRKAEKKKASSKPKSEPKSKSKPKPERKKKKRSKPGMDEIRAYIREGLALAKRLLRSLRLEVAGDILFGFEDPATTGLTLGAASLVGLPKDLRLRADWLQPGVEGWFQARGHLYGYAVAHALWLGYWRSPLSARLRKRFTFKSAGRKKTQEVEQHGRAG